MGIERIASNYNDSKMTRQKLVDFPLYTKKVLQAIKQRMSAPKTGMSDTDKLQALQQKFNLR